MASLSFNLRNRLFWPILLFCHVILLVFLYLKFGFNILFEGEKYLNEARCFLNGEYDKAFNFQTFYSFYILYLSFFLYLKLPLIFIFIGTYLISLCAYYHFYKLLKEKISEGVAKIWITCMLLSPMIQYWQFNLYSETFFIALSLLFTYAILFNEVKNKMIKVFALALLLIFSRPGGIFIVVTMFALYAWQYRLMSKKITIALYSFIGLGMIYLIVFSMRLHYRGFSFDIASGSIYMGFPTLSTVNITEGEYTLWNCYQHIIQHYGVGTLLNLFLKKWGSFFGTTRPYYTLLHNLVNGFHYVFYGLFLTGLYLSYKLKNTWNSMFIALLSIVLLNSLMVALIFNEWTERHTVQVFPFIFIIAAYTISILLNKFRNKLNT